MMKFLSTSIAVASLALAASNLHAQVSGIFHIGGLGDPYATIQEAVDDLVQVGVSGPVDLVVAPGVYTGGLALDPIPGAGASAPILIRPLNPGAYDVHITGEPVLFRGVVHIRVPFVSLHEMSIIVDPDPSSPMATSCVWVDADDVVISSCTITNNAATTSGVSVYGERSLLLDNVIVNEGADSTQGSTGLHVYGVERVTVDGNNFSGWVSGMYLSSIGQCDVIDNGVLLAKTTLSEQLNRGITLALVENTNILRNRIVMYEAGAGIWIGGYSDEGITRRIENNMVSNIKYSTAGYATTGIYVHLYTTPAVVLTTPAESGLYIRHNSLYVEGDSASGILTDYPLAQETVVTSNSIRMVGNGCVGLNYAANTAAPWPTSDYNNVSFSGVGNWYGIYQTKALIRTNTTMEDHSIGAVPHYVSKTNLHIKDTSPNINTAFFDADITNDYDQDPRPGLGQHDIGADEYGNLGLKSLVVAPPVLPAATVEIGAYPNPAQDQVAFELPDDEVQPFVLHGTDGRVVLSGMSVPGQAIRLDGLTPGTYIARFPQWPGATTRVVVVH
ncbi:MAG: right-handed parallel beta-helix repeat-containing protein [Flavobacteriales bacterium]|nr:MAG: right-handed parallel beta-helix repeat-containing protein [Flavobacteriales bacterium]